MIEMMSPDLVLRCTDKTDKITGNTGKGSQLRAVKAKASRVGGG